MSTVVMCVTCEQALTSGRCTNEMCPGYAPPATGDQCLHSRTRPMYIGPTCVGRKCKACEVLLFAPRGTRMLVEVFSELLDVADLRGDTDLPHPANDPKLWSARMQTAWDEARLVLEPFREEA